MTAFCGQVDSTEFAESAESAENHNFLSSLIKQPKNYPWTYCDTFSQILPVKNNSSFISLQCRVFVCGPVPKNENAEFAEGFKKFHLLYQCWIVVTVHRLIARYQCLYTLQITFETYFCPFQLFSNKKLGNFPPIPHFRFWPYTWKRKRGIRRKFHKIFPTLPVIFID